jgi:hypothetical protein
LVSVIYSDICSWLCGYFATCIVLILGSRLSSAFRSLCREFEAQILENTKKSKGAYLFLYGNNPSTNDLEYFETELQKLKGSFGDFQTIAGTYALAFVTEGSIGIVYFLFDVFQPESANINGRAVSLLGILEIFLTIFSFAHIGTYIELEVS